MNDWIKKMGKNCLLSESGQNINIRGAKRLRICGQLAVLVNILLKENHIEFLDWFRH